MNSITDIFISGHDSSLKAYKQMKEYYDKVRQIEQELRERAAKLSESLPTNLIDTSHRPPETIKRDIKHEKNPMRLKQLNQELNYSYKFYKGGKQK